ncbi:unnamed protein product [Moneuplotes crassus]|uniref:Uncharacterized protein n=1 Tax=Euplotes crassus TaxID=5936 RepID=A0AAD1ULC3_EUPCR|nr:unnamed protein product [Moneuplotes crassus]
MNKEIQLSANDKAYRSDKKISQRFLSSSQSERLRFLRWSGKSLWLRCKHAKLKLESPKCQLSTRDTSLTSAEKSPGDTELNLLQGKIFSCTKPSKEKCIDEFLQLNKIKEADFTGMLSASQ